ncbi:ATP-binding cassette domain-containing protein [Phycicoccus endophyticus]|uniref:ATP-binding cassette domain-containing protein n=1 Tax=Phycicoccus endophyticus TaxID=1690220 RepID=A0A7G9R5M4_9MICO|nr:ATP-binding cassette domain-containing protein [Phycicoccus endophyticus]QNN50899.1 ATP-binding cassette domain-containing protein [Phycicoccus endophyticus]
MESVSVTLAGADRPVLRSVDLSVEEGELALVVGRTGSGKSTLLGAMCGRVPHFTGGTLRGRVLVHGRDTREHRPRDLADLVGVVGQDPLAGFVTDTVEEELAYGMEQLGLSAATMRTRVEETLDLLGIPELRDVPLRELSGGQQQRVAIGSVLTAHPRVILLDEPTSALDPVGAEDVLATVTRLVHDLAVTVVLAEHRVERVLHHADRVVHVAPDGTVSAGEPAAMMATSEVTSPVVELGRWAGWQPLPLSVRDARRAAADLRAGLRGRSPSPVSPRAAAAGRREPVVRARGLVVRHPGEVLAVAGVDLDLRAGEVTGLMGRNGSGKSSLLWALQGSTAPTAGRVRVLAREGGEVNPAGLPPDRRRERVGLVPQSAADLLYLDTVGGECAQADRESAAPPGTCARLLARLAPDVPADRHPRDLSEGQKLALVLAVQLTADPPVLLLDEPTRGLDPVAKAALASTLQGLADDGRALLVATHDVEFVAECADRVVLLAAGEVVAEGPTAQVVLASPTLAPQVAKVLRPGPWLTVDEVRTAVDGEER